MINSILAFIWRLSRIIIWRKQNIYLHTSVKFNKKTLLAGYNKVHKRSIVLNSKIGRNTFIGTHCDLNNVEIGSFCSIAHDVRVEYSTHPTRHFVSTSPVFYSTYNQTGQSFVKENLFNEFLTIDGRNCIIGNDVWIGANVLIKGGVRIGDGAIVAMGSVITHDVQPYTIVGGIPAKIIRKRFNDEEVELLLRTQWWNANDKLLANNVELFRDIDLYKKKLTI